MHSQGISNLVCSSARSLFIKAYSRSLMSNSSSTLAFANKSIYAKIQFYFSHESLKSEPKDFSEFISDPKLISRLEQNGITKMFPVQEETFRLIEAGKDILASDRTGSGKTLGYTLPVI